jgi:hypothetical protein
MASYERPKMLKASDQAAVARYRAEGKTLAQVVQYINENFPRQRPYTEEMAKRDEKAILNDLIASKNGDVNQLVATELNFHHHVNAVAWEAYHASHGVQTINVHDISNAEGPEGRDGEPGRRTGKRTRTNRTTKQMLADPRILQVLLANREKMVRYLGIDEPEAIQMEVTINEKPEFGEREEEEMFRIFMEMEATRKLPPVAGTAIATIETKQPNLDW